MPERNIVDPIEKIIADSLDVAGIEYIHESQGDTANLDFKLVESGVFIEAKQFHTPRISGQMARKKDIIAVQGKKAAELFAKILTESSL